MQEILSNLNKLNQGIFTQSEVENFFDAIAIDLLQNFLIVSPNARYSIKELEFYYYSNSHPDVYAHKHKRQGTWGNWYFHRFKDDSEAFMRNKRNGVDMTFGNAKNGTYGGILLRKIQNSLSGELIIGINKIVQTLVKDIGIGNLTDIATDEKQMIFDVNSPLHLAQSFESISSAIYKSQRNGLSYNTSDIDGQYFKAPYCYYNHNLNQTEIFKVTY